MSEWFYADGEETSGPVSQDRLIAFLKGVPQPNVVLVWQSGFEDWKKAGEIPELRRATDRPPPLPSKRSAMQENNRTKSPASQSALTPTGETPPDLRAAPYGRSWLKRRSKRARRIAMAKEFVWLPEKFVANFVLGVKNHHKKHGWGSLVTHVSDLNLLTFLGGYPGFFELYLHNATSWFPGKRREWRTYAVSIGLAVESLGSNFAGSGDLYPEAKLKADEIVGKIF